MKSRKEGAKFSAVVVLVFILSMLFSSNLAFASNSINSGTVEQDNSIANYDSIVSQLKDQQENQVKTLNNIDLEKVDLKNSVRIQSLNTYETEPNNYSYQADIISDNLTLGNDYFISGLINTKYDIDQYRFTVNNSGTFLLVGSWYGTYYHYNWEEDLGIGLYDNYGNLLSAATLHYDSDGNEYRAMSEYLTPGTYYISILQISDTYGDIYIGEQYAALMNFEPSVISVTGVTLNATNTIINGIGVTEKLTETVTPSNATNKYVNWSSSNTNIATVDNTGKITSVGYGTATITATTEDGWRTASCTVTVQAQKDYSGIYNIRSKNSNLVMDVYDGGTKEGTNIIQWEYHGRENQQWKFASLGNGYYKITSVLNPTYSLDVYDAGISEGNRVIQWTYHGGTNQQWKIMENVDGSISVMSRLAAESGTRYVLDVYGGGMEPGVNVIQWSGNGRDNQKWLLEPVKSYTMNYDSNGGSAVSSSSVRTDSLVAEPQAPTREGMIFGGWYKNQALTIPWNFTKDRMPAGNTTLYAKWQNDLSGTYFIRSKNSNLVMDVYNGGTAIGTNIIQWGFHGRLNQQWKFESLGNGYYKITSVLNPTYSLDVYDAGTSIGNRVIQWTYHGGTNQQWKVMGNADGSFTLMSRLAAESGTGYVLDVFGGGLEEGVNVIQWSSNGRDNQKWYLEPVN